MIAQLIASLGFPIVMCLLLFWTNTKTLNRLQEVIIENTGVTRELKEFIKKTP